MTKAVFSDSIGGTAVQSGSVVEVFGDNGEIFGVSRDFGLTVSPGVRGEFFSLALHFSTSLLTATAYRAGRAPAGQVVGV